MKKYRCCHLSNQVDSDLSRTYSSQCSSSPYTKIWTHDGFLWQVYISFYLPFFPKLGIFMCSPDHIYEHCKYHEIYIVTVKILVFFAYIWNVLIAHMAHCRHLYVFGGTADSIQSNDLHLFDLDEKMWSIVEPAANSVVSVCMYTWLSNRQINKWFERFEEASYICSMYVCHLDLSIASFLMKFKLTKLL